MAKRKLLTREEMEGLKEEGYSVFSDGTAVKGSIRGMFNRGEFTEVWDRANPGVEPALYECIYEGRKEYSIPGPSHRTLFELMRGVNERDITGVFSQTGIKKAHFIRAGIKRLTVHEGERDVRECSKEVVGMAYLNYFKRLYGKA